MKNILILILALVFTGCTASGTPTPTPTPPPLTPYHLAWDDSGDGHATFYNVYQKISGVYTYIGTVYVPAPLRYDLPAGVLIGTTYAVTASDGAMESGRSNDATVVGVANPVNARIVGGP